MAEEKEEKKKAGIIKLIFKWIGLGVLSALIILGLIFEAPWKVITLLLIVLAACTVLPKPVRKWFWLSVGVVVIALIIWVFLPEADGDWRPYTFDDELADLKAKYTIPDEENAAIIYNQLLDNYDSNSFYVGLPESKLRKVPMREPWLSQDHPEIEEWLEGHQTTISTLLRACEIEKCRFPITADIINSDQQMNRLAAMRRFAYLLISAANNDIAEGRIDRGLEKYIAVLQTGKHQRQQPALIDFLVGVALEALPISQFKRFIVTGNATDEHLSAIEEALGSIKYDWNTDFPKFLGHEKLFAKNFWGMFYEVNPRGKVRFSRDPYEAMRTRLKERLEADQVEDKEIRELLEESIYLTYWQKKLFKAGAILGWFFMPSTPQKAAEIIDAAYEQYYAMAEPGFDWQKAPAKLGRRLRLNYRYMVEHLTQILGPTYARIRDQYLRVIAEQRGCWLLIGLRRYKNKSGTWPQTLDEIEPLALAEIFVDPVNNSSFVYKLTEDGFKLYSQGKNNIDDGGERDEEAGTDDWLIWPPRSRKAKEESTNAEQQ